MYVKCVDLPLLFLLQLYLSQYGYLGPIKPNSSQLMDESSFRKAVEDFQSFAGLEVTGKIQTTWTETGIWVFCNKYIDDHKHEILFSWNGVQ